MSGFDSVLAELQAKMAAGVAVVMKYPEVAAEFKAAIDGYQAVAVDQETVQADEARVNALRQVISGTAAVLQSIDSPALAPQSAEGGA